MPDPEEVARAAAEAWEGTLDATKPGPDCAQQVNGDSDGSLSENCLYLNVYAPDEDKEDLPVVVFIHGGGYTAGTPNIYDGHRMAETGEAVVVPAYRLGYFGFFSAEGTAQEGEYGEQGNWGILDQQEALRWVRENIDSFGGDPGNVTIVGESAGGGAVCTQLASPTAEGLFHKAIVQSMGCDVSDTPRDMSAQIESWGCEVGDMACLREVPVDTIVATEASFDLTNPVAGGPDLPLSPLDAAREGTLADVPIIVGVTRDEWQGFLSGNYPMSEADYEAAVSADYGAEAAPQLLEMYPADLGDDPSMSLGWLVGDSFIICPAYGSAQAFVDGGYDVHFYEFADETAPGFRSLGDPFPPSTRDLGATHTSELVYLFDYQATQRKLTADQEGLASEMVERWINFAKTGEPTSEGAAEWKAFDGESVLELTTAKADGSKMSSDFADRHNCSFWNAPAE